MAYFPLGSKMRRKDITAAMRMDLRTGLQLELNDENVVC